MEPLIQRQPANLIAVEINGKEAQFILSDEELEPEKPFSRKRLLHYGLCAVLAVLVIATVGGLDHILAAGRTKATGQQAADKPQPELWVPSQTDCNPLRMSTNQQYPLCRTKILQGIAQSKAAGGQVSVQVQNVDNHNCSFAPISLRFNMSKTSLTEVSINGGKATLLPAPKWATTSSVIVDTLRPLQLVNARWEWFGPHRPTFQMEFCSSGFYSQLDDPGIPGIHNDSALNYISDIDYQWSLKKVTLKLTARSRTFLGRKIVNLDVEGIPINSMDIKSQTLKPSPHFFGCSRSPQVNNAPEFGPMNCRWVEARSANKQFSWQFVKSDAQGQDEEPQVFTQRIALTDTSVIL